MRPLALPHLPPRDLLPRAVGAALLLGLVAAPLLALVAPVRAAPAVPPPAPPGPRQQAWVPPVPLLPDGPRRPFEAPAHRYGPGHRGADLPAAEGATVRAAGAGRVSFAGRVAGRPVVSVDHPGGLRTTYEPVAAQVRAGDAVAVGAPLGTLVAVGSHCAPAACLHWGLRTGVDLRDYRDPLSLLVAGPPRLLPLQGPPAGTAGAAGAAGGEPPPPAGTARPADGADGPASGAAGAAARAVAGTLALGAGGLLVRRLRADRRGGTLGV